ncbi:hypothetical protein [Nostoc sp. 'Peltigera malacea cyanobiont' DB3992]|uniref:hypothetical protein n=1 Tax=Nostoc sp. 'Peltigera malacea cyanobiont' DB3992 TaxID=1206980 RepID=UPI00211E634A|nr:hypothetical protein [Nostoc sp. 'Peltigera malacea cyanobiont' DB3992]
MTITTNLNGKRGIELLQDPSLNKSTAFTEAKKQALGLVGLVPDVTESEDLQLRRVMQQLGHKSTDLALLRSQFPGLLTMDEWLAGAGKPALLSAIQAGSGEVTLR